MRHQGPGFALKGWFFRKSESNRCASRSRGQLWPAAAANILAWRHQVLADLQSKGVLSLDVFPEEMTAPLVNSYLEIKARRLL